MSSIKPGELTQNQADNAPVYTDHWGNVATPPTAEQLRSTATLVALLREAADEIERLSRG